MKRDNHSFGINNIINAFQTVKQAVAMALRLTSGVESKGVLVTSNDAVTVIGSNQLRGWSQDVFLVNAIKDYSREFLVASKMPAEFMKDALFTVICVSDDTTITIWKNSGSGYVVWQSLTLNRLETFTFSEQSDPTGMKIVANKPVNVQSGSSLDTISTGMNGGDHMCISLPPISRLSRDHFITPIAIRNDPGGYHVRVIAAHDDTVVSDLLGMNAELATLSGGTYYELGPVTSGLKVRALRCSKPCLVVQYNMGPAYDGTASTDVFLMRVPSIDFAVLDRVILLTPRDFPNLPIASKLNIVTWSSLASAVRVDGVGVSGWVAFSNDSPMVYATVSVNDGQHEIWVEGGDAGFLAWLYGNRPGEVEACGTSVGCAESKCSFVKPLRLSIVSVYR